MKSALSSVSWAVLMVLLTSRPALALPKDLAWGMSPEQAQKLLGAPSKTATPNKVYEDDFFNTVDYAGRTLKLRLTFKTGAGLIHVDGHDAAVRPMVCADMAPCRGLYEKFLGLIAADVAGVSDKYEESPGQQAMKLWLKAQGQSPAARYVVTLGVSDKDVGHLGFSLDEPKEPAKAAAPGEIAVPAGTKILLPVKYTDGAEVKLEPAEQVAFLFVDGIHYLERNCTFGGDWPGRPCTLAELLAGVQAKSGAFIRLVRDPADDPSYSYTLTIAGGSYEIKAIPKRAGLGAFAYYSAPVSGMARLDYSAGGADLTKAKTLGEYGSEGDGFILARPAPATP